MLHFKFLKCNLEYLEYDKNNTRSKSWKNLVANGLVKKLTHNLNFFGFGRISQIPEVGSNGTFGPWCRSLRTTELRLDRSCPNFCKVFNIKFSNCNSLLRVNQSSIIIQRAPRTT